MIDFNTSWNATNDNKIPNRLSQRFIFESGCPRFSYALFATACHLLPNNNSLSSCNLRSMDSNSIFNFSQDTTRSFFDDDEDDDLAVDFDATQWNSTQLPHSLHPETSHSLSLGYPLQPTGLPQSLKHEVTAPPSSFNPPPQIPSAFPAYNSTTTTTTSTIDSSQQPAGRTIAEIRQLLEVRYNQACFGAFHAFIKHFLKKKELFLHAHSAARQCKQLCFNYGTD